MLNRKVLTDIYFDLSVGFIDTLERASDIHQKIAMIDRTNQPLKRYKWLRSNPRMVPWIGERQIEKLQADGHVIENKDWAIGIEIERDDLRDDADFGSVQRRINGLAETGMATMEEEVVMTYVNGFTAEGGLAYDGQFLIDEEHTMSGDGSGEVQSNKLTSVLSAESFSNAYQILLNFKDETGRGLNVRPRYLLTGPNNWATGRQILVNERINGGDSNPNQGLVEQVISPYIEDGKWFLIAEAGGLAPVILQVRQMPEFRAPVQSLDDYKAYRNKKFDFGVDATFGVAPAAWQLVVGSDASE